MTEAKSPPITLITGTSRGIGRHLAERYLFKGHTVIGMSRSRPDFENSAYHHFAVDIADEDSVKLAFQEITKRFGYLDHLINNAGISSINHSLLMPMKTARKMTEINLLAPFLICQNSVRLMRKRGGGRIVNFSTIGVPLHSEGVAMYAATKAAIEELTRILAGELGSFGITVNCVGPSVIDTDLGLGIPAHHSAELLDRQSIKRKALPEDVGHVVDFFLSPTSDMISAQVIYLGGFC